MWRPTDKPGIFRHDDCPCCDVEITEYHCENCGERTVVYHRVSCDDNAEGHVAATEQDRAMHANCRCGEAL